MAHYKDFKKLDKICPLLSNRQIVFDDSVIYCLGDNCMWFDNYCKPKSITIMPVLNPVLNEKDPEP